MIEEYYTNELVMYTVTPRKDKGDEYSKRKIQKDRKKLFTWLLELLKENEILLDYLDDDGNMQSCICSMKSDYEHLLPVMDVPVQIESYRGDDILRLEHLPVVCFPGKTPKLIHIDNVRRFILKNDNVADIAQRLYYTKY